MVPPVLVGAGELVELIREEGGNELLLLSSRAGGELEDRGSVPEEGGGPAAELLLPVIAPVPQGILSPFG